jgi:hypothetical protein
VSSRPARAPRCSPGRAWRLPPEAARRARAAGGAPALRRCLNDPPWEGWPYAEPAPPETSAYEDVVSAALRLAVTAATMPDGTRAAANLTKYSRWAGRGGACVGRGWSWG